MDKADEGKVRRGLGVVKLLTVLLKGLETVRGADVIIGALWVVRGQDLWVTTTVPALGGVTPPPPWKK